MKKARNILLSTLCLMCVFFSIITPAEATNVCFTAVNDTLYELSDSTMPVFINSELYVPYSVFVNTTLNIGYIYDQTAAKFTLYKGDMRLAFNMNTGKAYDQKGNSYSKQCVMRNSRVYVPAQFVCGVFGLHFAYLTESELGDIVRITNESAYLDSASFPEAATYLMSTYLEKYNAANVTTTVQPTVSASTRPSVNTGDVNIFISFEGLSEYTGDVLEILEDYDCTATFFVTEQEIREYPDLIRKIAGKGHSIGIKCAELSEYVSAAKLLFQAVRLKTFIITAPVGTDAKEIEKEGLVLWQHPDGDNTFDKEKLNVSSLNNRINETDRRADLRFECSEGLAEVLKPALSYLQARGYNIKKITETDKPYQITVGGN